MTFDPTVFALFESGVTGVAGAVDGWSEADWDRPACGEWSGTDLAGHLVTVIGWYHLWLDHGLAGVVEPGFGIDKLDAQTAAALAALPPGDGPSRIDQFVDAADRYGDRLVEPWDTPFAYPRGLVTAGLHAGVAAAEWHLHAWDFAQSRGELYEPAQARELYLAAARCQLTAAGGVTAKVGMAAASAASRRRPWAELLRHVGRT